MKFLIRDVDFSDAEMLLAWRNEPEVRKFSHFQGIISKKEHLDWLHRRLNLLPSQPFWIFENELGMVGATRFDFNPVQKHFEISITINSMHRGQGLGKRVLDLAITNFLRIYPGGNLYAETHQDNKASRMLFLGCGFKEIESSKNFLVFERIANTN